MGKGIVRTAGSIAGTVVVAVCYYQWLNVAPTVTIPNPVLPSPNGRDALVAATKLLVDIDKVNDAIARVPPKGHRVYTTPEKAAIVASNAPALAAMRQALPLHFWNLPARSATTMFPEFAKYRAFCRLLTLESQVRAAHGDYVGAVNSLLDADQIGLKVPLGGVLIADLVGIACESIGDRPMWALIDKLDAEDAQAAAERLEAITAQRFPFGRTMQEEKWIGQAMIVDELTKNSTFELIRTYTSSNAADGNVDEDGDEKDLTAAQKIQVWESLLTHSKRRILADYSATMDMDSAQTETPFSAPQAEIPIPKDPINYALFPILRKARFKDVQIRMQSDLITCALALRAYRLQHGDYPNALADLVSAGILHRVPDDVFAKTSGTPFGYKRISTDKYLLYSVGPDGIDDGGKPVDLSKTNNPSRYYPDIHDKGDWVVGVDAGRPDPPQALAGSR